MRGRKKLLESLTGMTVSELILAARDVRRAADAAAIGGATDRQWREYNDTFADIKKQLKKICPKREHEADDYLNRGDVKEEFAEDGVPVVEDRVLYIKLMREEVKRLTKLEKDEREAKETAERLKHVAEENQRQVQSTLSDVFATGRRMQLNLHHINSQAEMLLKDFISKNGGVQEKKALDNIIGYTKFVYDGEIGFPRADDILPRVKFWAVKLGETRKFNDYTGWRSN